MTVLLPADCRRLRRALAQRGARGLAEPLQVAHRARCSRCAALAEAAERSFAALSEAPGSSLPPAGFAGRVLARLPRPAEQLGDAALRLLPLSALTAAAAVWLAIEAGAPFATPDAAAPTAEWLTYLLLGGAAR